MLSFFIDFLFYMGIYYVIISSNKNTYHNE